MGPSKKKLCKNCANAQHIKNECPLFKCGRCNQFGHLIDVCKTEDELLKCQHCSSNQHSSKYCPVLWREYKDLKQPQIPGPLPKWCYHCGEIGHFGDACGDSKSRSTSSSVSDVKETKNEPELNKPYRHAFFINPIPSKNGTGTASDKKGKRTITCLGIQKPLQSSYSGKLISTSTLEQEQEQDKPGPSKRVKYVGEKNITICDDATDYTPSTTKFMDPEDNPIIAESKAPPDEPSSENDSS